MGTRRWGEGRARASCMLCQRSILSHISSQKCPSELGSYHLQEGDQGKVTRQNVLKVACDFGGD